MSNALGQLPNAPLIYVLAQVCFTHVPRMDKRYEDFHDKVFSSYPRVETERIDPITFKDGQAAIGDSIQRWHLSNESKTTGIVLDAGVFVFHTTEYSTSDEFLTELKHVLAAFVKVLPEKGVLATRIGLRYVDLLLPEGNLNIDKQVIEPLRLPNLAAIGEAQRMDQVITYRTSIGGTMVIRHRQSTTTDVLPADLFPIKLKSALRLSYDRPKSAVVGVLDYDHIIEQEQPFDIDAITSSFRNLREISSAAFKATTTRDAILQWSNGEPQ